MKELANKHKTYQHMSEGLDVLVSKLEMVIEEYAGAHMEFSREFAEGLDLTETLIFEPGEVYSNAFGRNLEKLIKEVKSLKQARNHYSTMSMLLKTGKSKVN